MPIFSTLRDRNGIALVMAMLPLVGQNDDSFRPIVVGPANKDPYATCSEAIRKLAKHYGLTFDPWR
jgi:hypothetical protein